MGDAGGNLLRYIVISLLIIFGIGFLFSYIIPSFVEVSSLEETEKFALTALKAVSFPALLFPASIEDYIFEKIDTLAYLPEIIQTPLCVLLTIAILFIYYGLIASLIP